MIGMSTIGEPVTLVNQIMKYQRKRWIHGLILHVVRPSDFCEHLKGLGYTVEAMYHEPGMSFAGIWTDEFGDENGRVDFDDENWDEGMSEDFEGYAHARV
jgi:hypothetical protein